MHKMFRIVSLIVCCAVLAADAINVRVRTRSEAARSGSGTAEPAAVTEATPANDGSNDGLTQEGWLQVEHPAGARQRALSEPETSRPRRFATCDSFSQKRRLEQEAARIENRVWRLEQEAAKLRESCEHALGVCQNLLTQTGEVEEKNHQGKIRVFSEMPNFKKNHVFRPYKIEIW